MSTAYCAILSELRDAVSRDGLDPVNGGFFILAAYPDDVHDDFDVWAIDIGNLFVQGDAMMLSTPIPATAMQLASNYQSAPRL